MVTTTNTTTASRGSFSTLQHLLQLSYSEYSEDQQKAAIELARLIEGTVFPAVSFGPLAHALSRLVPSKHRTVASYSARALKLLLLDDALRPQAVQTGVASVVCSSIAQWEDEVLCLRELLGALQTLSWDKTCIKSVIDGDVISYLIDFVQASDQEVSVLALAVLTNIFVYVDTLLLTDTINLNVLSTAVPVILEALRSSQERPQRFYAAACIANASAHPRLASLLKEHGALKQVKEIERQSLTNLHMLGSKLDDCAKAAVYRLSDYKEGQPRLGNLKFSFKWGTRPVMELSLAAYGPQSQAIMACFGMWLLIVLLTFMPAIFA